MKINFYAKPIVSLFVLIFSFLAIKGPSAYAHLTNTSAPQEVKAELDQNKSMEQDIEESGESNDAGDSEDGPDDCQDLDDSYWTFRPQHFFLSPYYSCNSVFPVQATSLFSAYIPDHFRPPIHSIF